MSVQKVLMCKHHHGYPLLAITCNLYPLLVIFPNHFSMTYPVVSDMKVWDLTVQEHGNETK